MYTVKAGDTLSSIYGSNWKQASGYQGDPKQLQIGTSLPSPQPQQSYSSPQPQQQPQSPLSMNGTNIYNPPPRLQQSKGFIPASQMDYTHAAVAAPNTPPGMANSDLWNKVVKGAVSGQQKYGVPASVTLAQFLQETGGKHFVGNNLFGIKGTGPAGSIQALTREGSSPTPVYANFRAYANPEQSIEDHAKLLAESGHYKDFQGLIQNGETNPDAYSEALRGYATDPNYTQHLKDLIRQHDLVQYDAGAPKGNSNLAAGSSSGAPQVAGASTKPKQGGFNLIPSAMAAESNTPNANPVVPDQLAWGRPDASGAGRHYGLVGQNNLGVYTEPGLGSFGGSLNLPFGGPQVGGTIGMQDGQPFGSYNINHQVQGQFGPQDNKPALPDWLTNNPIAKALSGGLQTAGQLNNQARQAFPNWAEQNLGMKQPSPKMAEMMNMAIGATTGGGDMSGWSNALAPASFVNGKPLTRVQYSKDMAAAIDKGTITRPIGFDLWKGITQQAAAPSEISPDLLNKVATKTLTPQDAQQLLSHPEINSAIQQTIQQYPQAQASFQHALSTGDVRGLLTMIGARLSPSLRAQIIPLLTGADSTAGAPSVQAILNSVR